MNVLKEMIAFVCILMILDSCSPKSSIKEGNSDNKLTTYIEQVKTTLNSLPRKQLTKRDSILAIIHNSQTFKELSEQKQTSQKYLPLLEAMGEIISSNNGSTVSITEATMTKLEENKELKDLALKTIPLSFTGGLPVEFVDALDRHQKKFGFFGEKGQIIIDETGNRIVIDREYDISPAFAVMTPTDPDVLDAVYEAHSQGLSTWREDEVDPNSKFPFIFWKSEYNKHLSQHYQNSKNYKLIDLEISANELVRVYEENEVAADDKYKNKHVAVSGTITDIKKDISDNIYVTLNANNYLRKVQCYLPNSALASKLAKGEEITLIGKCKGLMMNVILKDCQEF